jgi:crotonobetainyl-CoA:carnitine CoA-transferase CaiB-like acyl-CoA transferase
MSRENRKKNRGALTVELESALRASSADEWEMILNRIGVPAGRVLTVPEALENQQIKDRGLLQTFDAIPGIDRSITLTRAGFKLLGADPAVASPPPRLGEHTEEVLRDVGYSDTDIASLRASGAI